MGRVHAVFPVHDGDAGQPHGSPPQTDKGCRVLVSIVGEQYQAHMRQMDQRQVARRQYVQQRRPTAHYMS